MTEDDDNIGTMTGIAQAASARTQRLVGQYLIVNSLVKFVIGQYRRYEAHTAFTVAVSSKDAIYPQVHAFLLQQIPSNKRRALNAESQRSHGVVPEDDDVPESKVEPLRLFYDDSRLQTFSLKGHRIKVHVETPQDRGRRGHAPLSSDEGAWMSFMGESRVVLSARTVEGRDAVLRWLEGIALEQVKNPPRLYIAAKWGGFTANSDVPPRPFNTVILQEGQKERLRDDLAGFLGQENTYVRLGVPYHRGYLFYGPPGTGKTSVAKALAAELGLDVYYMPLPSVKNDSDLNDMLGQIKPKSMLLLEDIDIVHGTRERDDKEPGVTLSGLLNGLDGMVTPHGLITIMTTNHIEVLDSALLRPGRVDRREKMTFADQYQVREIIKLFLGVDIPITVKNNCVAPADIVEIVKRHLDDLDVDLALKEIRLLVGDSAPRAVIL